MEINLLKKPYEVSLSGNPVSFTFALSPYGAAQQALDIRLQIRILVEQAFDSGIFTEVRAQDFYPTSDGQITMQIQTMLDPYLDYYFPRITLKNPVQALNQRKRYKISWLLQQAGAVISGPSESAVYYIVKSGLNYESWHPSEFFTTKIIAEKKPLLFQAAGEKCGAEEIKYFCWMYPFADNADQIVTIRYYLNDNTFISIDSNAVSGGKWGVFCTPAGLAQSGFFITYSNVTVVRWSLQVKAGSVIIVNEYFFEVDQRNFYNANQLLYRNSIGGIETIRLRGQVDFAADYDRQLAQKTLPPSWYNNLNLLPIASDESVEELTNYVGDTGFISKPACDKLRDLFLSKQKVELINGRFLPININLKKAKFFTNKDSLISTLIEWSPAYGNSFYTPKNYMPNTRTCPALQSLIVRQVNASKLQIMYALQTPYDLVEIQVIINGTTYTYKYSGNTKTIIQPFANPATTDPVNITIRARTVCDENITPVDYGPFSTVLLSVVANQPPVANDDYYIINSGYNSAVTLSPSALANDSDPDGDLIEAIAASGTTNGGGAFSINALGIIQYTPVNSGYTGNDYFDYQIRQVGGSTLVTGRVHITVGIFNYVFAKIVIRNFSSDVQLNENKTFGDVWVDFFSNSAGTTPVDITAQALTISLTDVYRAGSTIGTTPVSNTITNIDYTRTGTGTKMLLFSGQLTDNVRNPSNGNTSYYQHAFQVNAGTGYTPI